MAANLSFVRGQARTTFATILCCALLLPAVLANNSPAQLAAAAPGPALAGPAPAPAPKVLTLHEKVVASLRAAGHYGAISGLLDSLSDTIIKAGITLFAPDDGAFNGLNMNSSTVLATTLNYHVATTIYNYQQLSNLPLNSTIQTAVPNVVIVVTSTGNTGLKLDNVAISDPDLYSDGTMSVQGISAVMNTAAYNKGVLPPEALPPVNGAPAPAPVSTITPTSTTATGNDATHVLTSIISTGVILTATSFVITFL